MIGQMSSKWRESVKQAVPPIVHLARFGRLLVHQVRYPVAATVLDWKGTILAGPFCGLRCPRSGVGNYFTILGTYEHELNPLIEQIIQQKPRVIIDVGAAYGYYALGFAKRCPDTKIIAYEMDKTRVQLLEKYRRLNHLDTRVDIRGICTAEVLQADLTSEPHSLVFVDIEGGEDDLLQPENVPGLRTAEMVVELHEMFVPGVTKRLQERFSATHKQTIIEQGAPEHQPLDPSLERLVRRYWQHMTYEERVQKMSWLHLKPV